MRSDDYNKYLAAIKDANDDSDYHRSVECLRAIYKQMVAQYGANERDVEYLFRLFRHNI